MEQDRPVEGKVQISPGASSRIGKKGAEARPGELAGDYAGDAEPDGAGVRNSLFLFTINRRKVPALAVHRAHIWLHYHLNSIFITNQMSSQKDGYNID